MKRCPIRISHEQFFQICNELQTQREVVTNECHNKIQLVDWIKNKMGVECSISTIEKALSVTKIVLEKDKNKTPHSEKLRNTSRVLASAILALYRELGLVPPPSLTALNQRLNFGTTNNELQSLPEKEEELKPQVALSIPMKSVPQSQTIPVVTKKV